MVRFFFSIFVQLFGPVNTGLEHLCEIIKIKIKYMRFTISSTGLLSRLQSISRVIASKNAISILDNFLFELNNGKMKVTASDSETTMETFIDVVEFDSNGSFTMSGKSMLDALKEIPEQPIAIVVDTNTFEVKIEYMNGVLNLVGQNPMEYPKAPEVLKNEDTVEVAATSNILLNGISKTLFATDNSECRPTMNGIYFDFTADDLTIVASNGHILVRYRTGAVHSEGKSAFILPKKPATMLRNILPKEEEEVKILFNSRNAVFSLKDYVMTCRLTEGRYPNYNAVIPTNAPNVITIDRASLLGALKRVSICSLQSGGLVKFSLNGASSIVISGQDRDFSSSAEESVGCIYEGSPMDIGFNSPYLIEMLVNLPGDEIKIELLDQTRAGIITPVAQEDGEDLLMLLTPMML